MDQPRLKQVQADPDAYTLTLEWQDGTTDILDCTNLDREFGQSTMPPDVFATARIILGGWGIAWNNDEDIGADTLWELARMQADQGESPMSPLAFKSWLKRNGLILDSAVDVLGLGRRTLASYSSGSKPIPRVVALACMAIDFQRTGRRGQLVR